MNKTILYLFICLFVSINLLHAQEESIIFANVDEVIALALEENPDVSVYLLQQEKATANYKLNKNYYLPTVTGTASYQNNLALQNTALPGEIFGQSGQNVNVQIGQQFNYNAGINISKSILDREAQLKAKVAQLDVAIAESQTEIFKQTLKEQTAFYYYSTLIGKQAVEISKEDLKICDSMYQLTTQRFKEGLIDLTNKNQAEINRNKVEQSVLSNQNIYNKSLNSLKLLLGIAYGTSINFTEELTPNQTVNFISATLSEDKNLTLKTLEQEQTLLNIKKEKSGKLPTLSFNGYLGKQQLRDNFGVSFGNNAWQDYSYVGLNLTVPIFSGFSKKNKVKVSKIENAIAIKNLQIEKDKSLSKDAELLNEFQLNYSILKQSEDNFKLTKDNTDLAMLKYKEGLLSLESYLKLYEDYLNAENNYLNSLSVTFTQYATILSRQSI
ncbi:MAG: TolC family protein [Flavobacteriaceae bacterium]|nr:TolC family protein [Flavobacteriaceae bacterium]